MKQWTTILILLAMLCPISTVAFAHKIRVFAYAEGDNIIGETAFSGGRAPKGVEVIVENGADGSNLLTTSTDDNGRFSFAIPEVARQNHLDLRIVVNVGEGHRNEWLLAAAEYLPDADLPTVSPKITDSTPQTVPPQEPAAAPAQVGMSEERLRLIVTEVVEQQLSPVKRQLAENRERAFSLQDILGGIGYIFGLAGIAAYISSKKGDKA
jgi:nickel transport protein